MAPVRFVVGAAMMAASILMPLTAAAQAPAPPAPATPPPAPSAGGAQTPPSAAPATPQAAPVPFPADAKIGAVDLQAVLAASKMGQQGQAQLKALNEKWAGQLKALADKVQVIQQEIQTQQATLSSTALMQKRADLNKAQLELQYEQQQRDSELQTLGNQLSTDFEAKVLPIIEAIRQERGLWLILEVGETPVAALGPGLNLSPEVVTRLDAGK